jgi:multiple antibiotic resistance protein
MQDHLELLVTFFVQMLILVDPVAGAPVFLAITPGNSKEERHFMALRGCLVAWLVICFFILAGPWLLGYFGIQTPAVQICGGVLLFAIALEMLYGRTSGTEINPHEERLAETKKDVSITPLAVPLLAGPGAIATALLFAGRVSGLSGHLVLLVGLVLVFAVTYLFLRQAALLERVLGRLGLAVITRIMGLVLAFLAAQYAIDGVRGALGGGG